VILGLGGVRIAPGTVRFSPHHLYETVLVAAVGISRLSGRRVRLWFG
jgi:hypothetical protein